MSKADERRPAGAQPSRAGTPDWPNGVSASLGTFAVDRHMIAFYDGRPRADVEDFQFRHISKLLSHAAKHSRWWAARLRPARGGKAVSFEDLPLMTREDFRASLAAAAGPLPLPPDHGIASENATSGSSGIPLSFYYSGVSGRMNLAHNAYDRVRHGFDPNLLSAVLTSRLDVHAGPHIRVPPSLLLGRNEEFRRLSKQFTIEQHARWLAQIRPGYFTAHTSVLMGIVDTFEQGIVAPPARPIEALVTFAETVPPAFRLQARRVLGARVLDRYSCEEVGPLAFQCPVSDEHYHIASTNALVEVLDENGAYSRPGEIGRVYVTSLHNFASPVVRYELGDLAAWAPRCVCGYDNPVLLRLLGRTRFLVRLPSGERKQVRISAKEWLGVAPLQEARVVQVSEGVIRAECVLDRALTAEELAGIDAMLKREISPDLTYEVAQLERIDWGPTYKRQDVVSLI